MSLWLLIKQAWKYRRGILPAEHISHSLTKVSLPEIRKYILAARKGKSKPENTRTFNQHVPSASLQTTVSEAINHVNDYFGPHQVSLNGRSWGTFAWMLQVSSGGGRQPESQLLRAIFCTLQNCEEERNNFWPGAGKGRNIA